MKKVTLKDLNGKEIESYFATDNVVDSVVHSDNYEATVKDIPSNKDWAEMTGGGHGPLLDGDDPWAMAMMDEATLKKAFVSLGGNVGSGLGTTPYPPPPVENEIKIDDTLPSDFLDTTDLQMGRLYTVAGLGLVARFVAQITIPENKTLIQMNRHDTLFYVEEGQLIKSTLTEVDNYLNEPF